MNNDNLRSEYMKEFENVVYRPPICSVTSIKDVYALFPNVQNGADAFIPNNFETDKNVTVTIMCRVANVRGNGKLVFIDAMFPSFTNVNSNECVLVPFIQLMIRPNSFRKCIVTASGGMLDETFSVKLLDVENPESHIQYVKNIGKSIRPLDEMYVTGKIGLSSTGEKTIDVINIIPIAFNTTVTHAVKKDKDKDANDSEMRLIDPWMKWLTTPKARYVHHVYDRFLENLHTLLKNTYSLTSIQVPHLVQTPSGANARPFTTVQNDDNMQLFLRIATEIELKMANIGGLSSSGVYTIGSQFRNEGIDSTHNPEFTSLEAYFRNMAFKDLINIQQYILSQCVKQHLDISYMTHDEYNSPDRNLRSQIRANYTPYTYNGELVYIDWFSEYPKLDFMGSLQSALKDIQLPSPNDLDTDEARKTLESILTTHKVHFDNTTSVAKMLDKLFDHLVLPKTCEPIRVDNNVYGTQKIVVPHIVYGHPKIMSPLAMECGSSGLTYRLETFVLGMEISNGYQELSNPKVQTANFESQQKFQASGDKEAMSSNTPFIRALETGMCPTIGWGLGIDRVIMFLTDSHNIRDILPFPLIK